MKDDKLQVEALVNLMVGNQLKLRGEIFTIKKDEFKRGKMKNITKSKKSKKVGDE